MAHRFRSCHRGSISSTTAAWASLSCFWCRLDRTRTDSNTRPHSTTWFKGGSSMAEPFLSEIRIFSFVFAPKGWATCDGQLLSINQNQALFSLLGTSYGGDGRVNFALPN